MTGHVFTELHGVMAHCDAVGEGEKVEDRLRLIWQSNSLSDDQKWRWGNYLKSFCLYAALLPHCGSRIWLGNCTLRLEASIAQAEKDGDLPGVRVDHWGDLVLEGCFYRHGSWNRRYDEKGYPLWPLIIRDAPVCGPGPWKNFEGQAFKLLNDIGLAWPMLDNV